MTPQIISSLFDLVREVFNTNNSKKKTKWLSKLIIALLILTTSICFTAIGILTKEIYSLQLTMKQCKVENARLKKVEREYDVLHKTNDILTSLLKEKLPDKEITIITDRKVLK